MRSHVIHQKVGSTADAIRPRPTAGRPVARARFPGTAPVTSTELWVGVHLVAAAGQEPGLLEQLALCAQRFTPRVSRTAGWARSGGQG